MKDQSYWTRVHECAALLESDGCTGVPEFYHDCCLEHDVAYRTGHNVDGEPRTKADADAEFRRCQQARSRLGRLSPIAWWRWAILRFVVRGAYKPTRRPCSEVSA